MVEDNQQHGAAAEEYGERVEVVVGYHCVVKVWMGLGRGELGSRLEGKRRCFSGADD